MARIETRPPRLNKDMKKINKKKGSYSKQYIRQVHRFSIPVPQFRKRPQMQNIWQGKEIKRDNRNRVSVVRRTNAVSRGVTRTLAREQPQRGDQIRRSFARRTIGRASRGCTRRRSPDGDGKCGLRRKYLSPSDCNEMSRKTERERERRWRTVQREINEKYQDMEEERSARAET